MLTHTIFRMTLGVLTLLTLAAAGCGAEDVPDLDAVSDTDPDPAPAGVLVGEAPGPVPAPTGPLHWLIHGGQVLDGLGTPPRRADVLLSGDRIAYVGVVDPDTLEVAERFDAQGMIVAPGFIDLHAHGNPVNGGEFRNFLAMGVTTIVLGQDGGGPEAGTLTDWLDGVDAARPRVNVATLVGHNTLRAESGVGFDPPSPEGSARIAALVDAAMAAGAFGLSTGLEYTPGTRADVDELAAVAQPVARRGGVVMSHMRNEDHDQIEASVAELLEQGRRSGAAVHASHLKIVLGSDTAQARRVLDLMDEARAEGLTVTADLYPYTASFTGLAILFPDWARPPNDYDRIVQERGDELAAHLRTRVQSRNGPEATLFGAGELDGFGPLGGHTLAQVAEAVGRPYEEVLMALGPGGARAAYFVMDEAVMATFLRDPWVAVASDGSPTMSHPRGYGSFARVIRHHVLDEGHLTLEDAVRKMSALPASILGLDDLDRVELPRGRLAEGWGADLVVFDPAAVRDRADFPDPHQLAEGMRRVWVNGRPAWTGNAPAPGPGHGRAIRRR